MGNLSNECVTSAMTLFKLIVEELWPDRPADAAAITVMFGSRALDWWTNLGATPGAQQRLTEARGLRWWPGLTTPAEQDERIAFAQDQGRLPLGPERRGLVQMGPDPLRVLQAQSGGRLAYVDRRDPRPHWRG